jgi:sarcosine oxidase
MSPMNRRTFLGSAAVGVGSLALPGTRAEANPSAGRANSAQPTPAASDVVVVGAGAFGGWTALYLREMGVNVTLVDAYGAGNARASSGGETRQIRAGYANQEYYTRWVVEAFARWKKRQVEWGRSLFFETGQIQLAQEWTTSLKETQTVLDRVGVATQVLTRDDVVRRFPQVNAEGINLGVFTPGTGVLKAREGCQAVADAFQKSGGRFTIARASLGKQTGGKLQDVTLSNGQSIAAQSFVFAVGPWLPKVFPDVMANKMRTPRQLELFYGTPPGDERFTYPNFPNWAVGGAYGFPSIEGRGFKVAMEGHLLVDPDTQQRVPTAEELAKGREFVARWFPLLKDQPLIESKVCQYEMSVDSNFIVQRHPALENVWLVGGGSGHGYKHGIVLGEYVANRVLGKPTDPALEPIFRLKTEAFS